MTGVAAAPTRRLVVRSALTLAVLLVVFFGGGGWYFANVIRADGLAVERDSDPVPAPATPADLTGRSGPIAYTEVTYRCGLDPGHSGSDQKAGDCPAWFVPQEAGSPGDGKTWAILLHGRGATRAEPLHGLAGAVRAGLPALDLTYRNDEGVPRDASGLYRYGETEWADLSSAVQYARDKGARDVVLFGYSMGGAIVASLLERDALPIPVRGVVLDAPMLDFGATVDFGASHRSLPLVGLPIPGALVGTAKALAGARFDIDWDAIDYLDGAWLDVPALVIHGEKDRTVPPATSKAFAASHPQRVKLVLVPDGTHVGSWKADPAGYDRAIDEFLASLR